MGAALSALVVPRSDAALAAPTAGVPRPRIEPRSAWGEGLPTPTLPLEPDVKFLLVHHTETPNGESTAEVVQRLRSMHRFHTRDKGWPDIAYNFLVDGGGRIWEGRTGSLDGPVKGDATGGSQGHAMLCCFIGDHSTVPPTPAAQEAMSSLLAWLASTYRIDLFAGATISFVSRGSNRWAAGKRVTTTPVAGHRDMSMSACPGDAAYPLVRGALLSRAQAITRAAGSGGPTTPATEAPVPVPTALTSPWPTPPVSAPTGTTTATSGASGMNAQTPGAPTTSANAQAAPRGSGNEDSGFTGLAVLGAAGSVATVAGAALLLRRRPRNESTGETPPGTGSNDDNTTEA